jgi:hypothetical protein
MGLAHSDDWRSLLATVISTATTPQPDDLSGVAELYGDNRREFVDLLGPSQSRIAMLRLMPERWFRAEVRSAADGELLSTVPFLGASYAPVELVALNGLLDNGADALGLLTRHRETGAIVFQWRDAVTGERLGNIYFLGTDYLPVDVAFVADAGGTGRAGIALLAMSGDGKATLVQTRFLDTGEVMSNVYFAAGELSPRRLHLPGDTDGNGVPDYSVLADRPEDGRILVQTRNSIGEPEASTVFFLGDYHDVIDSEVLPGAGATPTALAVLARRTYDRKIVVQRRNLRGDPQPVSSFFLTRLYKPRSLAIIDTPADGRQYVVLARNYDSGGVLAQAKRVADNLSTHVELFFEPGIVPTDLRVLNDQGLFVLGYRGGDDATLGQVRNLADGATVNVNFTREF